MKALILLCHICLVVFLVSIFSGNLHGQRADTKDFIIQVGITGDNAINLDSTFSRTPLFKLSIGRVGARYFNDNGYFHFGVLLGYSQVSGLRNSTMIERKTYYISPRFDFRLDKLLKKGQIYFGMQTRAALVDIDTEFDNRKPDFVFDLERSIILGFTRDIKKNSSIYFEFYGVGDFTLGFGHIFRRNKSPSLDKLSG